MSVLDSSTSLGAPEAPIAAEPAPGKAPLTDPELHFLTPGGPDKPAGTLDARGRTFLQALRRRWRSACLRGLLAALALAAATYWAWPARYTARALIQLLPQNSLAAGSGGPQEDFAAFRTTQAALLCSRPVLQAALARPGIADLPEVRRFADPVGWMEKTVAVDDARDSEILAVNLSGSQPEDLAAVLNALVESYVQETIQQKTALRSGPAAQLQQKYQQYRQTVRQQQQELQEREGHSGAASAGSAPLDGPASAERLADAKQNRRHIQEELETARAELSAAREQQKRESTSGSLESAIEEYLKKDPAARVHQARLTELDDRIARIEELATPAVREELLERPRQERDRERAALAACRDAARRALAAPVSPREQAELTARINRLAEQVAKLTHEEQTLSRQVEHLEETLRRHPPSSPSPDQTSQDTLGLRAELARSEAALHKIGERLELLQSEPMTPLAAVLQPALPPRIPDRGQPLAVAGLAASGSFFLVVYALGRREFQSQKVYGLEDLHSRGLAVIGAVPALPPRALRLALRSELVSMGSAPGSLNSGPSFGPAPRDARGGERQLYWQSLLLESIDTLRAQLLRMADSTGLRVFMITSALSGEGKTSLACHLAAGLARAWRKTLLVDGDLREPQIHQHFDIALDPGLSEVLRGEAELDEAIRPTALPRLWLLSAGRWDSYAVQALAQAEMQQLFDSLKEQYDFIILDSSPVLSVADALSLGQHVDGVVLSVLTDHSRLPAVRGAHHRLSALGIRVLGTVLHGAREEITGVK
jgi:polysaccharide biosynthesis transport protein